MGSELSGACFNDNCVYCEWGGCECVCHEWQVWDPVAGWLDDEED